MSGRASDQASWLSDVVRRYETPLIRYTARRLNGDVERARDVVQDAFLQLCRQDREAIEAAVGAWLYRVCRNRALDVVKKESRMTPLSPEPAAAGSSREPQQALEVERKDSARAAHQLLERLPDNQREVIRLKLEHDLSYREIADITGHSVSNVGYLLHVGLKTLRERLRSSVEPA